MLEFGRALMLNPKFLLVDEPAAGLAPKVATGIYENLEEIAQNIGVLMVEQNVDKAMELSDYIYILKAGQILEEDNSENLIGKTDSLVRDWLI